MGTHELGEQNKAWNRKGLTALDWPSKAVGNNERVINEVGVSTQQTRILDRLFWQLLGVGGGEGKRALCNSTPYPSEQYPPSPLI